MDWSFVRQLCETPGVSGDEDRVRSLILRAAEHFADDITVTPLGCVVAAKRGKKRSPVRVMLCAHMDEPGFLVTRICDDGLLRLVPVGDVPAGMLCGRSVTVCTGNGDIPGVLGAKPVHLLSEEERKKPVTAKELFLDIGALDAGEARRVITPGDRVVFASPWNETESALMGRALAGRAACAVLVSLLQEELEFDLTFAFTTLGETGAGGLQTAASDVRPEAVFLVGAADCPASDAPCTLGKGPSIRFMESGAPYDKGLYRGVLETAEKEGVLCQEHHAADGKGRAGRAAIGCGARTLALGIPCRCPDAPVSLMEKADIEATVLLLRAASRACAAGTF